MGIRGRLILAMGFVVATTVLSVTVPQWITLSERTRVELENRNLVRAESIAQRFGPRTLGARDPALAQTLVEGYAAQVGGRVLVVDAQGLLIADSDGVTAGTPYATAGRPEIVGALAGEPTSVVRYSADLGQEIMATAVPIILPGTPADPTTAVIGAVRITQGLGEVRANQRSTLLGLVAVGGGALAAGLLLAFALASSLARPMRQVTSASERFGGGELEVRSGEVGGSREIRRLAAAFDAMADRIARLVRSQREFVGNASHQLRTPLTGMKLQLEGAIASTDDPEMREQLVAADREVDRLAEIVARLLATARGEETKDARVDVGAAAARAGARGRPPPAPPPPRRRPLARHPGRSPRAGTR